MHNKIKTVKELRPLLDILRATGRKIVFTNGCFDLIHTGHTRNTEAERMETLAALENVDYVVLFNEPDPHRIIAELQPDVLVKGGDWPVEKIIGRDIVEARGGKVVSVGYIEGASTTGIIEKIVQKYNQ